MGEQSWRQESSEEFQVMSVNMIKGCKQSYNCAPNPTLLLEYTVTKHAISQKHLTPGH